VVGRLSSRWLSRAALGAVLLFALLQLTAGASSLHMTAREGGFLATMNRVRAVHGLPPLTVDLRLVSAARGHSVEMVRTKTFAHGDFGARAERNGVTRGLLGETLGWAAPVGSATDRIVRMWLRSPEHRVILLGRAYRTVGVGISIGPFKGWPRALVVTADYHAPAQVAKQQGETP
jgi:uncharacterized protein YkwD